MVRSGLVVLTISLLVIAGCGNADPPSVKVVPAPAGDYADVAWLSDGTMVALVDEVGDGSDRRVVVRLRDGIATPIQVDDVPGCGQGGMRGVFALPDGRIGFTIDCSVVDPPRTPTSVRAVDATGGASEELVRLPSGAAGGVTFNPDLSRGLYSESSLICAGIGAIEAGDVVPSDITIVAGDVAYGVSDLLIDQADTCTDYINAHRPAWSPDGATVAFFGSPGALGLTGTDRLDAPWHLYLVPANGTAAEPVVTDIAAAYSPAWSPDSASIAFSSDDFDGGGTWMYQPDDGSLRKLSDVVLRTLSWSPDGTQLAGIRSTAVTEPSEVVLLDISQADRAPSPGR